MPVPEPMRAVAFIPPEHPFRPHIDAVASAAPLEAAHGGRRTATRSLLRALRRDSAWQLKWLYTSTQSTGPEGEDFAAETIVYTRKGDRIERYTFPNDPYLVGLEGLVSRTGRGRMHVLRYVPRRRLTFRLVSSDGEAGPVAKVMRPADVAPAYARLAAASEAAKGRTSFSLAAPRGVVARDAVLFQEAMPGRPLADLTETNYRDLLRRAGAVHGELHELSVRGVGVRDERLSVNRLARDLDWIEFFFPSVQPQLRVLSGLLSRATDVADPHAHTFLHGDFRPSNVVVDGERWSLVDLDDVARGDPYAEIASFIALLKYDTSVFRERFERSQDGPALLEDAADAYLRGYESRAGQRLAEERLAWHRIAAEIHLLARLIARDLVRPQTFDRMLALVDELRGRITHERVRGVGTAKAAVS